MLSEIDVRSASRHLSTSILRRGPGGAPDNTLDARRFGRACGADGVDPAGADREEPPGLEPPGVPDSNA